MQVHTFIADSAADAVTQIRAQLGPQAVVLSVRPLPAEGLSRLWQKPKIEVLAHLPEVPVPPPESTDALAQLRQELSAIRQKVEGRETKTDPSAELPGTIGLAVDPGIREPRGREDASLGVGSLTGVWRIGSILENTGLLPVHAQRVVEELRIRHGDAVPVSLGRELEFASEFLRGRWNRDTVAGGFSRGVHVLIGPPGVGKTVCLCKWLAHTVLVDGQSAAVWRLDGRTANTAEALSVYSEILGIPIERSIPANPIPLAANLLLIDLPGVDWNDSGALIHLSRQIQELPKPRVHLVLNAAYETSLVLAQARSFAALPIDDVIFTHLDEELRWGKLWNVVLGTNFSISYLSAGQNIPGAWTPATPEQILARQFPVK